MHNHKVQIAGDLMITNHERAPWEKGEYRPGVQLFDISRPDAPKEIGFFPTCQKGVHRFWFADGRYALVSSVLIKPDAPPERKMLATGRAPVLEGNRLAFGYAGAPPNR